MKAKATVVLSIVSLLVVALGGSVSIAAAQSTSQPSPDAANSFFIPLVAKDGSAAASSSEALTSSGSILTASNAPQPGDSRLRRDKVSIDFNKSRILFTDTNRLNVALYLVGSLPDPCHVLRIERGSFTTSNIINVVVYSLVDPASACVTVLQPFTVTYPLGTFPAGQVYTVVVNGTKLGTFGNSFTAAP